MAKPVTQFTCSSCAVAHKKWSGRCDDYGEWNTIREETPHDTGPGKAALGSVKGKKMILKDLRTKEEP